MAINWEGSFDEIMDAYQHLIDNGWIRPPVRTLIYQLNGENPQKWEKKHYGTLTRFLQRMKNEKILDYGLFASDTGGADGIPLSMIGVLQQIRNWKESAPLQLSQDGNLYLLFHEHAGMIPTLNKLFDYRIGSVSSQGQIRHEHLHKVLSNAVDTLHRLKGNEIRILGIADYDIYGAKGYDEGQGYGTLIVGNLFAIVSTDPKEIWKNEIGHDPIGPENDRYIREINREADLIIVAWGNHGVYNNRGKEVLKMLSNPHCLEINTITGEPAHPLYMPKDLKPKPLEAKI